MLFFFIYQTLTGKLVQVLGNMPSSPESSSDSSVGSPHNQYDGPNLEAESALPAVVSTCLIICPLLIFWVVLFISIESFKLENLNDAFQHFSQSHKNFVYKRNVLPQDAISQIDI